MLSYQDLMRELHVKNDSKIVMLVADGLGGLPMQSGGKTELEAANTPHLDALVADGVCGLSIPVLPGIAPGSGPGHLGLFGYDPLQFLIGRGALEATGIGLELQAQDVAVRGNFCTLDAAGKIVDRRAGRIASEESLAVVQKLKLVKLPGVEVIVEAVKEHRFVVIFRGPGLGGKVRDTDPQQTGVAPLAAVAEDSDSQRTADLANQFVAQARELIKNEKKANGLTLRGFSAKPNIPTYQQLYGLRAAAIAVYPMYKGLASLVGMDIVGQAKDLTQQIEVLKQNWDKYDFFFLHFKYTDAAGEDGDFAAKVRRIEELDGVIPAIRQLGPTVMIVTGDHSTPASLKSHSWHPVPTVLHSDCCRPDSCTTFGEDSCLRGGLGQFQAQYLMGLAMANAGRLSKFGA
jgi:2,3-bisphosphoglycerate-independent phosphoglycerate mutase